MGYSFLSLLRPASGTCRRFCSLHPLCSYHLPETSVCSLLLELLDLSVCFRGILPSPICTELTKNTNFETFAAKHTFRAIT